MSRSLWPLVLRHQNGLLACLFVVAVAIAAFGVGAYVGHYRVFPYQVIREAATRGGARHCSGCNKYHIRFDGEAGVRVLDRWRRSPAVFRTPVL